MRKLILFIMMFFSFSVHAQEGEMFYSFGGISHHYQQVEDVSLNEVHLGFGLEYINTISFLEMSKFKYSLFAHYMAEDSFNQPAYWFGAAGFYRFEPFQSWELDLGLGMMYLNKNRVTWFKRPNGMMIEIVGNQQVLPMPYVGINKYFGQDSFLRKIAFNLIHAPSISGHNDISVTYVQMKLQLNF